MKTQGINRSSEKTKKAIRLAFAELLKEKNELRKISVSELVKRADINRSTFYIHYDSIYNVAEEFEAEIIETLSLNNIYTISIENMHLYFDEVFKYLKKNEQIYRMLLFSDDPLLFLNKLNRRISNDLFNLLNNNEQIKQSKSLKFDVSFFVDGIVIQLMRYFTEDNFSYDLDDIKRYMEKYFKILFLQ